MSDYSACKFLVKFFDMSIGTEKFQILIIPNLTAAPPDAVPLRKKKFRDGLSTF